MGEYTVELFQERIGAYPDGLFGPNTLIAAHDYMGFSLEESAHFFGQCAHETSSFRIFEENLNYSASGLRRVFPRYFNGNEFEEFQYKPKAIASRVYANRMGNGDEASGDGWKYRGRGAIQLTGTNNYNRFAKWIKDNSILHEPDLVTDEYAFDSAEFYFSSNGLWHICDVVNDSAIKKVTRKINGGYNGLDDRIDKTYKYYDILRDYYAN